MRLNTAVHDKYFVGVVIAACTILISTSAGARFESFDMTGPDSARMNEVAEKVGLDSWPRGDSLRPAPHIAKDLLVSPSAITRERVACSSDLFKQDSGAVAQWTWDSYAPNPDGVPNELPQASRNKALHVLTDEQRSDPNLVKERLARALEAYQKAREEVFLGHLRVDLCRAPNARAAQEFLIAIASIKTSLPSDGIAAFFSAQRRAEGLGNVAFRNQTDQPTRVDRVAFVRDNIAAVIEGWGNLAHEVVPLAQKIDAMIQKQPVITKEQLQASRPVVSIGATGRKADIGGHWVDYTLSVPHKHEVASVLAYLVNSNGKNPLPIVDGKIRVVTPGTTARVRLEVFTTGLLSTIVERDVTLLDEPVGQ